MIVSEPTFREKFLAALDAHVAAHGVPGSVTGPGRSGAVASVYASHHLGVPWIPYDCASWGAHGGYGLPMPILVVDTASGTGKTMRRARRLTGSPWPGVVAFSEPPVRRFWYERAALATQERPHATP